MAWIPLTLDDFHDYLAAPQAAALAQELLASGQDNPLDVVLADTVARVRSEIRARADQALSADPLLIPRSLKGAALALAIDAAQGRIPALELTPDQVRRAQAAEQLLRRVARGELLLEAPDVPELTTAEVTAAATCTVASRPNRLSGPRLSGL